MARDTDSLTTDPLEMEDVSDDSGREDGTRDLTLRWSGQISLTRRILAVNIFALLLLAGGFFYLDSYRSRIVDSRVAQAGREVRLIAEAIAAVEPAMRDPLLIRLASDTGARIRIFDPDNRVAADTRALACATSCCRTPTRIPGTRAPRGSSTR